MRGRKPHHALASGARSLFIYYRLDEQALAPATCALQAAQARLCAAYAGLEAGLLWSPAPSAQGERTVMETYRMDEDVNTLGVTPPLQAAIEAEMAGALRPWLVAGRRRTEDFVDAPCAS